MRAAVERALSRQIRRIRAAGVDPFVFRVV